VARLLEGLLEVSRIARGKVQLDCESLDLREVVQTVADDRAREIASRGLVLERSCPEDPLWVWGDAVRLTQVLDNLIGNAVKFTDSPGVIRVELQKQDADVVRVVRDTGVGIRAELLARVFEPFQQEKQDIARSAGGLGLGLAVAKGLVEMHRGSIEACSAGVGTGTEFRVRLPLTAPRERAQATAPASSAPRRRVLVVEDNEDAAQMVMDLLALKGHDVAVAGDGPAALEHLRRHGADVALCDLGLPSMTGYELAREIRADHSLSSMVVLVALTGYGQPEDFQRTREAGFDEHLVTPVDLAALERLLGASARRR
jgi:two-component system, chemotaxis family, CheB/CheR fusion protein